MSRLVEFYRGAATDTEGRQLEAIWAWNDHDLEAVHDFIQWLFPLPEPSRFNPDAPLLSAHDIRTFRSDPLLQAHLQRSFERILTFLGLTRADDGAVIAGENFAARAADVWANPNHNWLRITRVLESTRMLGLEVESRAFFTFLKGLRDHAESEITLETFLYWEHAAGGPPQ